MRKVTKPSRSYRYISRWQCDIINYLQHVFFYIYNLEVVVGTTKISPIGRKQDKGERRNCFEWNKEQNLLEGGDK